MSGKIDGVPREWLENYAGLLTEHFALAQAREVRELLAAPVVERQPVAWIVTAMNGDSYFAYDKQTPNDEPLYTCLDKFKELNQ